MKRKSTVLMAIAIAGICMASCKAAENETHAPADAQLTDSELSGSANLAASDRTAFIDKCYAHRTELFTDFMRESSIKPNDKLELKNNIDETFLRFCGCLERGLESGLSKMQFLMAETMIGQGTFISYPGTPMPEFEALKKAAVQLGMSGTDFESARQKFRMHASHSAEACFLVLWGPTLAQRMGMPELRSYSGPPAASK